MSELLSELVRIVLHYESDQTHWNGGYLIWMSPSIIPICWDKGLQQQKMRATKGISRGWSLHAYCMLYMQSLDGPTAILHRVSPKTIQPGKKRLVQHT